MDVDLHITIRVTDKDLPFDANKEDIYQLLRNKGYSVEEIVTIDPQTEASTTVTRVSKLYIKNAPAIEQAAINATTKVDETAIKAEIKAKITKFKSALN